MRRLRVLVIGKFDEKNLIMLRCSGHTVVVVPSVDDGIEALLNETKVLNQEPPPPQRCNFDLIVTYEHPSVVTPVPASNILGLVAERFSWLPVIVVAQSHSTIGFPDDRYFSVAISKAYRITGSKREPLTVEEIALFLQVLLKTRG